MQLDLFIDSPSVMNPNKNPMAPDCFRDFTQYGEWLKLARLAKESCTICEDCTAQYKAKMKDKDLCHEEWHSVNVLMNRTKVSNVNFSEILPTRP